MMEFLVETFSSIFEISELVTKVKLSERFNDGCSKFEFSYINDDLIISNGNIVSFKYGNENMFKGYVFKVERNDGKEISVVAYDQLRYCKTKDTIVVDKDTVTGIVKKMCNYFNLKIGSLSDTKYILPTSVQDDKTWLDIVYTSISDNLMATGKRYSLRDNFGSIELKDLEELTLDLILGDESLVYGYSHTKSIDDNYYNQIKLALDNEKTGVRDVYITKDSNNITRYGLLQYFEVIDKNYNKSQAKNLADTLLKLYNKEFESLDLKCLGDAKVRSGTSFYANISDLDLNKRLIVKSVTHNFLPVHTMDLEVII